MGYDYPECFISYNNSGGNDTLSDNGDDDVTICFQCLFDELLHHCELRGRSAYYAQQNITKYEVCWMCKEEKRLLYRNIPIHKYYRNAYGISKPEEEVSSEKHHKYSCLECFEKKGFTLFEEDDTLSYAIDEQNCEFCERNGVACLMILD